jgi:hypothetical protein
MKKSLLGVVMLMALFIQARHWTNAYAATGFLYAHNYGTLGIFKFDPATFTVADTFTNLTQTNGRGVVVVGTTMYYTDANSGSVYSYTTTTHTNNGVLFAVAGASGLSTAAFDGTNLWLGDYSGTNQAYQYSLTGTLVKTIHLANCTGNCDGLEFFLQGTNGRLISNRADEPVGAIYDVYDTNGTLLTPAFITVSGAQCGCTGRGTGIAWDGTTFYVSNIEGSGQISRYNGTTGAYINTGVISNGAGGIEDLSADYAVTLGPPVPTTPAPSTLGLMLCGLLLVFILGKKLRGGKLAGA